MVARAFRSGTHGDYFLIVRLDTDGAIREASEIDNVRATDAPVRLAAPFTRPSVVGPARVRRAPPGPGGKGTAVVAVENVGNVAASGAAATLFLSGDRTAGPRRPSRSGR